MPSSWRRRLQNSAIHMFSLPPDTVAEAFRLSCVDAREVVIENVVSLTHVSESHVALDLGRFQIHLEGSDFVVNLVAGHEVHLTGAVEQIRFVRLGGEAK